MRRDSDVFQGAYKTEVLTFDQLISSVIESHEIPSTASLRKFSGKFLFDTTLFRTKILSPSPASKAFLAYNYCSDIAPSLWTQCANSRWSFSKQLTYVLGRVRQHSSNQLKTRGTRWDDN